MFKVGDKVEVIDEFSRFYGDVGIVIEETSARFYTANHPYNNIRRCYVVEIDGSQYFFDKEQLKRKYGKQFIIAIDFDNTISISKQRNDGSWFISGLKEDADIYINKLHEDGHYIILWTCREGASLQEAIDFCRKKDIHIDRINANCDNHFNVWDLDSRKICADIYIDDAGILGIPHWKDIYKIIKNKAEEQNN